MQTDDIIYQDRKIVNVKYVLLSIGGKKGSKNFIFRGPAFTPHTPLSGRTTKKWNFFAASKMAKQYRSLLFTALDEKHSLKGWEYKKNYIYLAKMKEKKALLFYSTIYRKMREGKFWFC